MRWRERGKRGIENNENTEQGERLRSPKNKEKKGTRGVANNDYSRGQNH
jgi:hypothetical protein